MKRLRIALIAALATAAGCAGPRVRRIAVPAPPRAAGAEIAPLDVQPSVIPIHSQVDLAPMLALMKRMVSDPLVRTSEVLRVVDQPFVKVDARVDYEARLADVQVSVAGETLSVTAVIELKLRLDPKVRGLGGRVRIGAGSTSCGYGEPLPRIRVTVVGRLRTVAGPALRFERRSWHRVWERHCRVTAFNISLENISRLPLIRERVNAAVEQALARAPESISLLGRATYVWNRANRAHELAPGVWLVPHPERMELSPVRGSGTVLEAVLTMHARPRIVLGAKPSISGRPMPPVTLGATPARADLEVVAAIPYRAVARTLEAALPKLERLRAARIVAFASPDQLAVGLELTGSLRGRVYLVGTPRYDPRSGSVSVPDLRFTDESRAALEREIGPSAVASSQDVLRRAALVPLPAPARDALHAIRSGPTEKTGLLVHASELKDSHVGIAPTGLRVAVVLTGTARMKGP